jgi:hypothetical protein
VRELREELRLARGEAEGERRGPLTPDEMEAIRLAVAAYVEDSTSPLETRGSMMRVRAVHEAFRDMILAGAGPGAAASADAAAAHAAAAAEAARTLGLQVCQRDHELSIFLNLIDKRNLAAAPPAPAPGLALALPPDAGDAPVGGDAADALASGGPHPGLMDLFALEARARAFEAFRRSFRRAAAAEEAAGVALNAALASAKGIADVVNGAAERIPAAVAALEKRSAQRAAAAVAASLSGGGGGDARVAAAEAAEADAARAAEDAKASYRAGIEALRAKRAQIESLQVRVSRVRCMCMHAHRANTDSLTPECVCAHPPSHTTARPGGEPRAHAARL